MSEEIIIKDSENIKSILEEIKIAYKNTREQTPLTQCITNFVTVTDCANASLAAGGSPIMAEDAEEVAEITNIASALVINIGTINQAQVEGIIKGAKQANETNTPIVFDPVGAGISGLRNRITKELVENYKLGIIRGNMSEIKAIARLIDLEFSFNKDNDSAGKGVDVAESDIISKDNIDINGLIVKELANELDTVVLASGPIDIISDGEKTFCLENGDAIMPLITGSGCMLSTVIGSYHGANDAFIAGIAGSALMAIAGEKAAEEVKKNKLGTGSFRTLFIDYISKLTAEEIVENANLFELNI